MTHFFRSKKLAHIFSILVFAFLQSNSGKVMIPASVLTQFLLSYFGEGSGTPFQYSCLEIPMDGGAW